MRNFDDHVKETYINNCLGFTYEPELDELVENELQKRSMDILHDFAPRLVNSFPDHQIIVEDILSQFLNNEKPE